MINLQMMNFPRHRINLIAFYYSNYRGKKKSFPNLKNKIKLKKRKKCVFRKWGQVKVCIYFLFVYAFVLQVLFFFFSFDWTFSGLFLNMKYSKKIFCYYWSKNEKFTRNSQVFVCVT